MAAARQSVPSSLGAGEMKIVQARLFVHVEPALAPGYRARLVRRSIAFTPSEELPVVITARPARA